MTDQAPDLPQPPPGLPSPTPPRPIKDRRAKHARRGPRPKLRPPSLDTAAIPGAASLDKRDTAALQALLMADIRDKGGHQVSAHMRAFVFFRLRGIRPQEAKRRSGICESNAIESGTDKAVERAIAIDRINPAWITERIARLVDEADQARDKLTALQLLAKIRGMLVDLRRVDITKRSMSAVFHLPLPAATCPHCGRDLLPSGGPGCKALTPPVTPLLLDNPSAKPEALTQVSTPAIVTEATVEEG